MAGLGRRVPAVLLLLGEAAAVVGWWAALRRCPGLRARFELEDDPRRLDAFLAADLVVVAGGALLGAAGIALGRSWGPAGAGVAGGGLAYATLHVAAAPGRAPARALGVAAMAPAAVATLRVARAPR